MSAVMLPPGKLAVEQACVHGRCVELACLRLLEKNDAALDVLAGSTGRYAT